MKARELHQGHLGHIVQADYAKGILQWIQHGDGVVEILVRNDNGFQGIAVRADRDISVEKTLKAQVKDDIVGTKDQALGWIRRKLK